MTPSWFVDAVQHLISWEAQHAELDRLRAELPSDADRELLRSTGQRQTADLYDGQERAYADLMRDLDKQVKRTTADVVATVPAMSDADRSSARAQLEPMRELRRARWALELLSGPRAARSGLRGAARAAAKVLPGWLLMVALAAVARRR